ncbi:hypothetical protein NHX12_027675, partial [Muraenolepis orangiensis]
DLDWKTVVCRGLHPLLTSSCNVTARLDHSAARYSEDYCEFRSLEFRSIQVKPGSAQSAGILNLDPKSTYHFSVVSSAGRTVGEPSKQKRIGPGTGLSGAAIAGIAEGIPCSLLALFTFTALLYLSVSYCKNTGKTPPAAPPPALSPSPSPSTSPYPSPSTSPYPSPSPSTSPSPSPSTSTSTSPYPSTSPSTSTYSSTYSSTFSSSFTSFSSYLNTFQHGGTCCPSHC